MDSIHFHEKQKFNELPIYIIIGLIQALFLWGLLQQVFFNEPWGMKPGSDNALIIINIGIFLFLLFLLLLKLKTTITRENIQFKFSPFHIKSKSITWNKIKQARIVNRDNIRGYGGYGNYFISRKGRGYTRPGK